MIRKQIISTHIISAKKDLPGFRPAPSYLYTWMQTNVNHTNKAMHTKANRINILDHGAHCATQEFQASYDR